MVSCYTVTFREVIEGVLALVWGHSPNREARFPRIEGRGHRQPLAIWALTSGFISLRRQAAASAVSVLAGILPGRSTVDERGVLPVQIRTSFHDGARASTRSDAATKASRISQEHCCGARSGGGRAQTWS